MFKQRIDADGVVHMNADSSGCPYCGATDTFVKEGKRKLVFHYPATTCCAPRVEQMINGLKTEMYQAEAPLRRQHAQIAEMEDKIQYLVSHEKQHAEAHLRKLHAGLPKLESKVRERLQNLNAELKDYKDALRRIKNAQ